MLHSLLFMCITVITAFYFSRFDHCAMKIRLGSCVCVCKGLGGGREGRSGYS